MRSSERPEDAPGLLAVFSDREIRARGYRTLGELLRDVPGFYVEPDPHRDVVFTRGVPQSILIVYDGVPLVFDTGRDDLPVGEELSLAHVRRVEVLRGPGTALWGANAFNGIVNVITDDGRDVGGARVRGEAGAGAITLGGGEVEAGARGSSVEWSVAARAETFRDRRFYTDTPYQYVLTFPVSVPVGTTVDGTGGLSASRFEELVAKAAWKKLTVSARYSDFVSLGSLSSYSHSLVESSRDERRRIPTLSARAGWSDSRGPWTWSAGAFYLRSLHDDRFPLFATAPAHRFGGEIDVRAITENFGADGRGEWTLGRNTVSGGFLVSGKQSVLATDFVDPQTGTETSNAFRRQLTNGVLQIYAQDRLLLAQEKVRLTLGGSFDKQTDFAASVNPRAGAVVRLGHGWIGKALYGEAIRTPDVFDVIGISGGAASGNVAAVSGNSKLKPEKIRTAELGAEYRRGTIANGSIALFASRADDLIEDQTSTGVVKSVNRGRRFAAGLETFGEISPVRGLDLNGSYAFVRLADANNDLARDPVAAGPEHVLSLGARWTPLNWLDLYAGNRFVSRRELRGDGDYSRLGPYTVTDLNLRLRPRRVPLTVALRVTNLFDAIYAHRDEAVAGRNVPVEIPGDRRSGLITVEGRF